MHRLVVPLAFALALLGCGRRSAEKSADKVGGPSPSGVTQMPALGSGLVAELAREAKDRPSGTPSVEKILAILDAQGQPIARQQQVLGTPLGAHYCVVAATRNGLSLSICEFDSEALAQQGKATSLQNWGVVPRRKLLLKTKTLLTVVRPSDDEILVKDAAAALKLFEAI
jgi:hypothetical protein